MKRVDLPYLKKVTSRGKVYWYFQRGKSRARLPGTPDSEEFQREYWAIRNGRVAVVSKTTWKRLIESYLRSPGYQKLGRGTKANYRRHCDAILDKNASKDVRLFRRKHAIAVRDALQDQWSKANERVAVLSILLRHAVDLEWIERNPVTDIEKLTGGSYEAWPDAMLRAYERATEAQSVERTIYELAIGTGQRLGDCVKMKWADFDGEFMSVTQEKTGAKLQVFAPARLQAFLATLPRAGAHILAKNLRQPLSKSQVQKRVEAVRVEIGAKEKRLVIHGWRYNAAKELADAGNSVDDIMSVTGHKTPAMARKYAAQASQAAASKRAQERRD